MANWSVLNSTNEVPHSVLQDTRKITAGKVVIDFGSGENTDDHIDFYASAYARIDKCGVVHCDYSPDCRSLPEILQYAPDKSNLVIVFFRVLSVLSQSELKRTVNEINAFRGIIKNVVVYDYLFNNNRQKEYEFETSTIGDIATVKTEWSNLVFRHYHPGQLSRLFDMTCTFKRRAEIPGVRNKKDVGTFLHFEPRADRFHRTSGAVSQEGRPPT